MVKNKKNQRTKLLQLSLFGGIIGFILLTAVMLFVVEQSSKNELPSTQGQASGTSTITCQQEIKELYTTYNTSLWTESFPLSKYITVGLPEADTKLNEGVDASVNIGNGILKIDVNSMVNNENESVFQAKSLFMSKNIVGDFVIKSSLLSLNTKNNKSDAKISSFLVFDNSNNKLENPTRNFLEVNLSMRGKNNYYLGMNSVVKGQSDIENVKVFKYPPQIRVKFVRLGRNIQVFYREPNKNTPYTLIGTHVAPKEYSALYAQRLYIYGEVDTATAQLDRFRLYCLEKEQMNPAEALE